MSKAIYVLTILGTVVCMGFDAHAAKYLSLTHIGSGTLSPYGSPNVYSVSNNAVITLTATGSSGWAFHHWEGDMTGTTNPKAITMNANKRITAVFMPTTNTWNNALERYVGTLDTNFNYTIHDTDGHFGWDGYQISMRSQRWRTTSEVDRTLWEHDTPLIVPWFYEDDCVLIIDGGSNPFTPDDPDSAFALAAFEYGMSVIECEQVPNEPLYFSDDWGRRRSEDEIIAYSFDRAMVTGDPFWAAYCPMVKSVVRCMDMVQKIKPKIKDFAIGGGSKRGWTTWLSLAADPRVDIMAPISIDVPNLDENTRHHFEVYGFYTPAVTDYIEYDIFCRTLTPEGQNLMQLVDPISYFWKARFSRPKFVVNSCGDQFFPPDSSRFYWSSLPGTKILRYTPNTDHSQEQLGSALPEAIVEWANRTFEGDAVPSITWTFGVNQITATTSLTPNAVKLWQAYNANARDFRLESIGAAWTSSTAQNLGNNTFRGTVTQPGSGYRAYMLEFDYGSGMKYTTEVAVTPDTLPYAGQACL